MTVWPSGLRRWIKAPVRKGVGSNPTAVTYVYTAASMRGDAETQGRRDTGAQSGDSSQRQLERYHPFSNHFATCGVRAHALADWRLEPAP